MNVFANKLIINNFLLLQESQKLPVHRRSDPTGVYSKESNDADPTNVYRLQDSDPTGVYRQEDSDPTGVYRQEDSDPTGVYRQEDSDPTGVYRQEDSDPTGVYRQEDSDPTGVYRQEDSDPTGVYRHEDADPTDVYRKEDSDPTGVYSPLKIGQNNKIMQKNFYRFHRQRSVSGDLLLRYCFAELEPYSLLLALDIPVLFWFLAMSQSCSTNLRISMCKIFFHWGFCLYVNTLELCVGRCP